MTATDPSHYFGTVGPAPSITIVKKTNGDDANSAPGPSIAVGGAVSWTYDVTNTGNVALTSVTVTDDQGVTATCPASTLAAGASMQCTASGTATVGQYANIGTASGYYGTTQVTATDPSHYLRTVIPVPEFPSSALPIGLIIGIIGAVLYIRETKENK